MRGLPAVMRAAPVVVGRWLTTRLGGGQGQKMKDHQPPERSLMQLIQDLPPALLTQALTHSSWVDERTGSYERLEFLGDSVLGLVIAYTLFEQYPESNEGEMARAKAYVVSRASCQEVAENIGLRDFFLERAPAGAEKGAEVLASGTTLGNVLEALIGACFL
ncbi:MAG: hypothetical protein H5T84_03610, partial [Thermoleophilia bacterium]|nr:hypothetical protein [Thermoleophilia bacterium]